LVAREVSGIQLKLDSCENFVSLFYGTFLPVAPELPTGTAGAEQCHELRQGCHKVTAGPADTRPFGA